MKLSVVYATRNEEGNIGESIKSVKGITDEIIVVDEYSTDKTREVAKSLGAKVYLEPHHKIFHLTKQKAIDLSSGEWILQLDADERVSDELRVEIKKVITKNDDEIFEYQNSLPEKKLFDRHTSLLANRDGKVSTDEGEYAAFFVPRRNYFLGKYLKYGGTYPDGVIRLIKKGKAFLPCKDVHEQMVVNGKVGWLSGCLLHLADKSFKSYLKRNSYYIDLIVDELKDDCVDRSIYNAAKYMIVKPLTWFAATLIRHKGLMDGWQGVVFSFFSSLRFPRAYLRYQKL